jgi:hypothetical protein
MITFYPRDIGLWRGIFDFNNITLSMAAKTCQRFHDRDDLIGFLKQHGVRLDDAANPLLISPHLGEHPTLGVGVFDVIQWTLIGWIKDDYT